jgi:hypothetical protein
VNVYVITETKMNEVGDSGDSVVSVVRYTSAMKRHLVYCFQVTELTAHPRSRFDTDDDCAAPKLKASKLDILKPPTLTANRILTCAKFKPSPVAGNNNNIVTKGLNLPQCNVNLVKLATNHQGSVTKVKESCGRSGNESGGSCKGSASPPSMATGEVRSKHGSIAALTELSVADKQRSGK